jgi:predicted amidohydrolase YtcJ
LAADLTFINANVKTLHLSQPAAQAIAIRNGKILKVGTNQAITPLIGKATKVFDLKGKTVVPGLIDTHVHIADFGRCLLWLDLSSAKSISQLQRLLKEKAMQVSAGQWIIGRGWNEKRFKEKRFLNAADLDEAASNNPVILYHEAALICAVNTQALTKANVTNQTAVPNGGAIDKNPQTGELTGILRECATNLVWQAVPEPSLDELADATAAACQELLKAGLTSVHWIILSELELALIQRLNKEGNLPIRVNVIVPEAFLKQTAAFQSADSQMLHVGGVFIALDGYLDSKTAAVLEPYCDEPQNSGKLLYTKEALAALVGAVLAMGYQPVIHAMGDKAVATALEVIKETAKPQGLRFRLEQAAILNTQLLKQLTSVGAVVTVQPKVITTEFAVWSATKHLGLERARWLHPLKTLLKAGVKVAGGSDCPMEPLSPMLGIQEVVLRKSFPEQRLSVEEALRMYTFNAAYASGEEAVKGSIEEGKLADLTVLSSDPSAVEPSRIKDILVDMVVVGGKVLLSH